MRVISIHTGPQKDLDKITILGRTFLYDQRDKAAFTLASYDSPRGLISKKLTKAEHKLIEQEYEAKLQRARKTTR